MAEERRGFWLGLAAYLTWGFFPLYWPLLEPASATEILAHRIVWSLAAVIGLITALKRWSHLKAVFRDPRRLGYIAVGSVVIAINWGTYIWGVNNGHVVETSLGYFINPLVTILLGVVLLGERLRPLQWLALGIAFAAVLELTYDYGRLPVIALTLAFSFGTYGLMKKKANVGSSEGLAIETILLSPIALAYLATIEVTGSAAFARDGLTNALLLAGTGIVTAVPLLLFGAAATRVSMTTLGLLQYNVPIIQFAIGLLVFHEDMTPARWFGFGMVWLALVIITVESLTTRRRLLRPEQLCEPAPV